MFARLTYGLTWSIVLGAVLLAFCAMTLSSGRRDRHPVDTSRSSRPSGAGTWLIVVASFSSGLIGAGRGQHEALMDRGASRKAVSAHATFGGIVCDATIALSSPESESDPNGGGPARIGRGDPEAPGGRDAGRVRSITVCVPGGRRPNRVRIAFLEKHVPAGRIHTGDRVLVTGRPELPRSADNPFGFDERRWLSSLGVHAVVDDPARIRLVHDHTSVRSRARMIRDRLRLRLYRRFEHQRHRALASAILLGDRTGLDRRISDRFVQSGLMHLLALSGLHIGLIGGIVYLVIDSSLRRLPATARTRRTSRTVLWAVSMGAYGTVVGWPVSVARALVMAAAFLAASTAGRRSSPWQVFGIAAAALLLLSPGHLYSAGFQLSFSAVGGLILVRPEKDPHPSLVRERSESARSLILAIRSSLAAGIATMPVLLFHFGSAPTAGILLSPPGILLMGPLLASTILAVGLPAAASAPLTHAAAGGFDVLIALGGVHPTWLPDVVHIPAQWSSRLVLPILVGAAIWTGGGRRRLHLVTTTVIAAAGLLAVDTVTSLRGPEHTIVFFSAGQGDASLIHFSSGQTMLIDVAPGSVRAVLDYCEATGIERIDTVVLTHAHADHTGGLTDLWRQIPVARVVHTGWIGAIGSPSNRIVAAGDTLGVGSDLRVDVLNPDHIRDGHGNDDSIVLRIRIGQIRILFMGDAETTAESRIIDRYGPHLESDVVKAGHHGSETSSSPRFVDATHPGFVILSAGRNNRFGHPSPIVVDRWRGVGADVHVTAHIGARVLKTNGVHIRARQ